MRTETPPERVERTDDQGAVIGYSLVSTSEWDSWSEHYDLQDQWVGSSYKSVDGDWEDTRRIDPPDVPYGDAPLSYAVETSGSWADEGAYTRLEVFDTAGQLVYSTASYADGSSEQYSLLPTAAEDGSISGYTGTWVWIDADGQQSSWDQAFDTDLIPVDTAKTDRVERTGEQGEVIGYSLVSTSEWDSWSEHYDLQDQWVGSSYKSVDGDWEDTRRIDPPDVPYGDAPLSYAVETSGSWADEGAYTRLEVFDTAGQLVYSTASYADGSSGQYSLSPTAAEDGSISGYTGTWVWIDADGQQSSWEDDGFRPELMVDMAATNKRGGAMVEPLPLTSEQGSIRLNTPEYAQITHATLEGRRNDNLRGNDLDNVLVGNDGNNRINGGRGSDRLTGGKGTDVFVLRPHRHAVDTITDFNPRRDILELNGERLGQLFRDGELRRGVLGEQLRFDAEQQTLLYWPANEADQSQRPIALAVIVGLSAPQFEDHAQRMIIQ
ncbi:MAG: hypothetical protein H9532_09240 [Vulcanococcus sp. Clear-D1]|nr:hypothetical protein [Vulcanococcus sp. Clear-D1]